MDIVIKKFGSTSFSDINGFANVSDLISGFVSSGKKVVAVVSAMPGETDKLLSLASSLSGSSNNNSCAEFDSLASTGEQVSASLLSLALIENGVSARSWNAHQLKMKSSRDNQIFCGNISNIENIEKLIKDLEHNDVAVITGFQSINDNDRIQTLGRGGTDLSALAITKALGKKECMIYKDVEGVYSADPKICQNAKLLVSLSYDQMEEMSYCGAKVLQSKATKYAKKHEIMIKIRSILNSTSSFTVISNNKIYDISDNKAICIAHKRNVIIIAIKNISRDDIKACKKAIKVKMSNLGLMAEVVKIKRRGKRAVDVNIVVEHSIQFGQNTMIKMLQNLILSKSKNIIIEEVEQVHPLSMISMIGCFDNYNIIKGEITNMIKSTVDLMYLYQANRNRISAIIQGDLKRAINSIHAYLIEQ